MRLDELRQTFDVLIKRMIFVVRLETKGISSRRRVRLVPVFTIETHKQTNNECLRSGTWVLKLRVVATRSTFPDVVENGQERIKTTSGTLFSSWI